MMAILREMRVLLLMTAVGLLGFAALNWTIQRCAGLSPRDSTRTAMWGVKRRILKYAHENGKLPTNLQDIPEMPAGFNNKTTDWWGNPIHFEMDSKGIVTLSSGGGSVWLWGWDAREGAPIERRFSTKKANGEWSDELVDFEEEQPRIDRRPYRDPPGAPRHSGETTQGGNGDFLK